LRYILLSIIVTLCYKSCRLLWVCAIYRIYYCDLYDISYRIFCQCAIYRIDYSDTSDISYQLRLQCATYRIQ